MHRFRQLLLLILVTLPLRVSAQSHLVLAAEDDWYPYSAKIGSTAQGFAVELISSAYKAVGVSVVYDVVPFSRAMAGVKSGYYAGCFNAGDGESLRLDYLVPEQALVLNQQAVWGGLSAKPVQGYQDFEGKAVGIANAYIYSPLLTDNGKIKKDIAQTELANLKKVALARIDYTIVDSWVARYLILSNRAELLGKVKQVGVLQSDKIIPVFSKTHPDGAMARELYDQGMSILKKDGTYDRIMKAWETKLGG